MRVDMVRAYVESLLERLTGQDKVTPDEDGDYPVRYRSALYYVRLIGDVDPVLQVFAVAVGDVKPTAALYRRLNDINATIRFARVFWVRGQVLVESDLVSQTLDKEEFDEACQAVATIADHFGLQLAKEFGGKTSFADEKDDSQPADSPARVGQYL